MGNLEAEFLIVGLVIDDCAGLGRGLRSTVNGIVDGDRAQERIIELLNDIPVGDIQESTGRIQVIELGTGIVAEKIRKVIGSYTGLDDVVTLRSARVDLNIELHAEGFRRRIHNGLGAFVVLCIAHPCGQGNTLKRLFFICHSADRDKSRHHGACKNQR